MKENRVLFSVLGNVLKFLSMAFANMLSVGILTGLDICKINQVC